MIATPFPSALEENLLGELRGAPRDEIPDGKVIHLQRAIDEIREAKPYRVRGRVTEVTGLIIKAAVPGVRVGEMCWVTSTSPRRSRPR